MACFGPLTAFYSKEIGSSGKRGITFDKNASFTGIPIKVPCGQCAGCRLEKSRQWAIRCVHESKLHKRNEFVTLTYDDKHLPYGGTLVKRHLQLFMKRLRRRHGNGIRFYGAGEYGERTNRPHYHVLLFNYASSDRKFYKNSPSGEPLYTSDSLSNIWDYGFNVVGDVTFDSCAYVARYVCEKMNGDKADEWYSRVDTSTGEILRMQKEFSNMSRRPGIGTPWFDKFGPETYLHDSVIMNGREMRPPRFYDVRQEALDPSRMKVLKLNRRRKALAYKDNNTPSRLRIREVVALRKKALFSRDV